MDKCNKHDDCMSSIREDIHSIDNTIAKSTGVIEGFMASANDFIKASRETLYSKGGLVDEVGNHGNQLRLQWGLLSVGILALIGLYFK